MPRLAPEMGAIFSAESEEYLSLLSHGFLEIEQGVAAADRLDKMFRAVHSLKGASRVMGCDDLARAAHGLEDLLDRMRRGQLTLAKAQFDLLSSVIDGFRRLLTLSLEDGDAAPVADGLLATLDACVQGRTASGLDAGVEAGASQMPPSPSPSRVEPDVQSPASLPDATPTTAMEVLKVPIARLDAIISQVGELLITHQRIQSYVDRCARVADQLEEGTRRAGGGHERAWMDGPTRDAQELAQALGTEEARMSKLFQALEAAVHQTRMVPLSALFDQVPKWVRDVSSALGKSVRVELSGADLELDKRLVECLRDPLLHVVRNAVDHGIGTAEQRRAAGKSAQGRLRLSAIRERGGLTITVDDDGAGLNAKVVRARAVSRGLIDAAGAEVLSSDQLAHFLLQPGFSTRQAVTEFSGRGVGLDVVATTMATLKGEVSIHSAEGQGCRVSMWVPPSLTSIRVVHVEGDGLILGIPSLVVQLCMDLDPSAVQTLEGRPTVIVDGQPLLLAGLTELLGEPSAREARQAVIVEVGGERFALGVDTLLGELEVMQKLMPARLARMKPFNGLSILGDGRIMLLLDPVQLLARVRTNWRAPNADRRVSGEAVQGKRLLLADDSLTTRVQLRRILEGAGYIVTPAVDGLDAWTKLGSQIFDGVVSDVQMPGLDGVQLTTRIRATPSLARLPVVLVTTLAGEEDQRRGMEAGANAYITKGSFDQEQLLENLKNLL